jgi:hypothetical protein
MQFLLLLLFLPVFLIPIYAESQQLSTDKGTLLVNIATDPEKPMPDEQTKLKIDFVNPQTNLIQEHIDYTITITNNDQAVFGPIPLTHTSIGSVTIPVELENGENEISVNVEGILFKPIPAETVAFTIMAEKPSPPDTKSGCLIATAAFGTELAPQVQILREIRNNVLLDTNSGTAFMASFNEFYYTFSPAIADLERQSPMFKETVKMTIMPLLSTLSILNYVDINSESEMLGYGIGIILLNVGMYFGIPALVIAKLYMRKSE